MINFDYLNRVKDLRKAEEPWDKLPDNIGQEPDLSQPNPDRKSEALKPDYGKQQTARLSTAAQETLTRARIESQIGQNLNLDKITKMTDEVKDLAPQIEQSQLDRLGINVGSVNRGADSVRDLGEGQPRDRAGELTGGKADDLRMVGGGLVSEGGESQPEGSEGEQAPKNEDNGGFFDGFVDTVKNFVDGVNFFKDVLGKNKYEEHVNNRGGIDTNGTPNPDAPDTGGPRIITPEILIGIGARKGSKGEPNPESQNGTGGPINETKANGGATGPAGEPVLEVDRAAVTSRDLDALRIRLEGKFRA